MPSRDTVHVPYDMNIIMVGPRKQVEMLKQHEIQKSHARDKMSYDVIMRHSTRNTRLRISRFSCIRTPQWLSNYHSDSVFNKSELYNFTFDFFSQDELIQVEAGNHQSGTTVIQQNVSSPV